MSVLKPRPRPSERGRETSLLFHHPSAQIVISWSDCAESPPPVSPSPRDATVAPDLPSTEGKVRPRHSLRMASCVWKHHFRGVAHLNVTFPCPLTASKWFGKRDHKGEHPHLGLKLCERLYLQGVLFSSGQTGWHELEWPVPGRRGPSSMPTFLSACLPRWAATNTVTYLLYSWQSVTSRKKEIRFLLCVALQPYCKSRYRYL